MPRGFVALAVAVLIGCTQVAAGAGEQAPALDEVFVTLGADGGKPTITYDVPGQRVTSALAPDAKVHERETGAPWRDASLSVLKPGERIGVVTGVGGVIDVYAEYASVVTRLVTLSEGYLIDTAGKRYKLVGGAVAAATGLKLGAYLLLRTDPQTDSAFDVTASQTPFAVASAATHKVMVTFVTRVPINTPPSDSVFLATNAQNWTPNAVRMTPEPGNRWTTTLALPGGSSLEYKYTRGTWATDERDAAGSEISNRSLSVAADRDDQTVTDLVARWADLPS